VTLLAVWEKLEHRVRVGSTYRVYGNPAVSHLKVLDESPSHYVVAFTTTDAQGEPTGALLRGLVPKAEADEAVLHRLWIEEAEGDRAEARSNQR
jgi:hypothetical protein